MVGASTSQSAYQRHRQYRTRYSRGVCRMPCPGSEQTIGQTIRVSHCDWRLALDGQFPLASRPELAINHLYSPIGVYQTRFRRADAHIKICLRQIKCVSARLHKVGSGVDSMTYLDLKKNKEVIVVNEMFVEKL